MYLEQVALVVNDYDEAISFFVDALGFELVEDSPALTSRDGRPKRWVVVRPPGAITGCCWRRPKASVKNMPWATNFVGRVGLFLRVEEFQASYDRMRDAGVGFVREPRQEPYGRIARFLDVAGNRWDVLGPRPPAS